MSKNVAGSKLGSIGISSNDKVHPESPNPKKISLKTAQRGMANRSTGNGPAQGRGDRRDTNPQYTGNARTSANHTNPKGSGSQGRGARSK